MNTEQAMRNEELTGEVASRRLGDLLLLPASYGGLALLIVNDHYLKSHLHNAVSGKLSDVAGLMFFPLLVAAAIETAKCTLRIRLWGITGKGLCSIIVAVGVFFLLMKTWQPAGHLYAWLDAVLQWPVLALKAAITDGNPWAWPKTRIVMDPTDLFALPVLLIPWWTARSLIRDRPRAPFDRGVQIDPG
jgi:hypothetical protein